MKILQLGVVLALSVLLSGCFGTANIQQAAQTEMIQYQGSVMPNSEAEKLLEEDFGSSNVPWDPESAIEIEKSRNAINGMAEYIKDRLNFDSSLPYYTYKVWFEFTANQYMKLQVELDKRILIPGAISEWGIVIYGYVKRDVHAALNAQRQKISATEASIEDKANEDTIQDMKNIYNTISPLVKMVL